MVTIKEIASAVSLFGDRLTGVRSNAFDLHQEAAGDHRNGRGLNQTPRNRGRGAGPMWGLKFALVHFLQPAQELIDPYYVGVQLGIENRC